jgi:hypothetical protein
MKRANGKQLTRSRPRRLAEFAPQASRAGRVRTHYAKQLAQHAVTGATALPILGNEIEVS